MRKVPNFKAYNLRFVNYFEPWVVTAAWVDQSIEDGLPCTLPHLFVSGGPDASGTVSAAAGATQWPCAACTFSNSPEDERCAMCGSARATKSQASQPKSGPKSAGIKKVRVKGMAPVDELCPGQADGHVLADHEGVWDAMLMQTNIARNNNKYYNIQIIESDAVPHRYWVWNRWGRVGRVAGKNYSNCGSDMAVAKAEFRKKFKDKTRNDWAARDNFVSYGGKYTLIPRDWSMEDGEEDQGVQQESTVDKGDDIGSGRSGVGKAEKERTSESAKSIGGGSGEGKKRAKNYQGEEGDDFPESKLENRLQDLVRLMCDVNMMRKQMLEVGYDEKKMPLGKLSKDTIKRGYQVLKKIEAELTANRKGLLTDLSSEFYTLIPHNFGFSRPPVLSTRTLLREKLEMIESLSEISLATKVLKAERTENDEPEHPVDLHYAALKCQISAVDQAENEWQVIAKYIAQTHAPTHTDYTLELLDLFSLDREADRLAFQTYESTPNRQLLWHGSRLTNFVGIVSQGLRIAPPEAPVTGYMFGKGLYFADMVSKSANYCHASKENPVGLLLLCEVALGHPKSLFAADYEADAKLGDALSVFGEGKTGPIPEEAVRLPDGVLVPSGNYAPRKLPQPSSLLYNEYVVYDTAQVRMRYLVKLKFNFH
eukprot:g46431.t1